MAELLVLNDGDDVAIALRDLAPGEVVGGGGADVTVGTRAVPRGHKIAVSDVGRRAPVRKYGQVIGMATTDIAPGDHVHTHNLAFDDEAALALRRGSGPEPAGPGSPGADGGPARDRRDPAAGPEGKRPTFRGYRRADGRVGTRNYLAILTSVNCSATTAKMIADQFRGAALDEFPNVDGVIALTHTSGCGMVPDSEGGRMLIRTLRGHAAHPNVSGLLVLGLGCEMVPGSALSARSGRSVDLGMPTLGAPGASSGRTLEQTVAEDAAGRAPSSDIPGSGGNPGAGADPATGVDAGLLASIPADTVVRSLTIQESGGVRATVRAGVAAVREMLPHVDAREREECDVSELVLGLECGGSDGYSGVTANPALGWASDRLVALGGTSVLAETPEVYGAEHLLTARATEPAVAKRLLDRIDWWRDYVAAGGGTLDNNPSPGNKAGGLTTILEKSLGAVAKGGTAPLSAVYEYAEPIAPRAGFTFMDTPGYDPVSVTGMVAGGANVVVFTTGRGSVFGCRPTPSIKVATNTPMYSAMAEDMDVNAGVVVDGTASLEDVGREILDLILAVASGERTVSEDLEIGAEEFIPWHVGAVT
ncbi:UxaA family hydrolase [Myceligenerans pegani]|uniref:Altronate dehydratase n=1 Tax=Myceligenerans pegani TaxID=2776917 RepID=A0ABR9N6M5_9MICO|nr:altronate dehydratase family protein [Myceligenerans sp. TRM 65318]MBE1878692.1 altronate dehydratase [Myceligenerans sp. TRM 65318]MBE3020963.1 altronate dehydratase [Myceligenerans sp. TRM 65318]